MDRFTADIIYQFNLDDNIQKIIEAVTVCFSNDPKVRKYLTNNLQRHLKNFNMDILSELEMSDPLPGAKICTQVIYYNNKFINLLCYQLQNYVVEEAPALYVVGDNLPTSRNYHDAKSADDILNSWRGNPGRGWQSREDPAGDVNLNTYCGGKVPSAGVLFCDQSKIGYQRHHDLFFDGSMQNLNKTTNLWEKTPFGVSTPESDARLLSRQIFRKNERGIENGIPRKEARLYNRYVDRDISEGLPGMEKDCIVKKQDMRSLLARTEHNITLRNT